MSYYGKYRAIVSKINDPEKMGRIKVQCPAVHGDYETDWCVPCMPICSDDAGILTLPSVGDVVWVEFEEGDPDKPLWVGGWWTPQTTPFKTTYTDLDKKLLIVTKAGHKVTLDDKNKVVTIEDILGNVITLDNTGIQLDSVKNFTVTAQGDINFYNTGKVNFKDA